MTTRRDFLKGGAAAATGIVFCSCGLLKSAHGQQTARQKLPVMVGGKRVKTIDVHAHCHFREAGALLGADAAKVQLPPVNGAEEAFIEIDRRLAIMDSQAIDMEVLSINPFWYDRDRDLAGPDREDPEREARRVLRLQARPVRRLRLADLAGARSGGAGTRDRGEEAGIEGCRYRRQGGQTSSSPTRNSIRYGPRRRNSACPCSFIRRAWPNSARRLAGNGWLANTIANPLGTTIALSHLIFEGTFDRFPELKVIAAHGGGYLPSYADRSDHACLVGPKGCNPDIKLKKQPTEYLKQIYFDSLVFTPEAIRHLVAQVGAGQIVLGSDYPYPWELHPVDPIFAAESLTDDQRADILGRTAAKLFNIRAA